MCLFRLDLNGIINYEEASGKKFDAFDPMDKRDLRLLLWAGIRDNLPEGEGASFTVQDAGRMMTEQSSSNVNEVLMRELGIKPVENTDAVQPKETSRPPPRKRSKPEARA